MGLKNVFGHVKFQTLVGWTLSYLAGIAFNALLGQEFGWKFWFALGAVLLVRILADLSFAFKDAKDEQDHKGS